MACNCSVSVNSSLQRSKKRSPSGVKRTLRVVLCSKRVPTQDSRRWIEVETCPLARPSCSAARLKLPRSATLEKIRSSLKSIAMTRLFLYGNSVDDFNVFIPPQGMIKVSPSQLFHQLRTLK